MSWIPIKDHPKKYGIYQVKNLEWSGIGIWNDLKKEWFIEDEIKSAPTHYKPLFTLSDLE